MKFRSIVVALFGLFGIFSINANVNGADILGTKMNTKIKSFDDVNHGTQDWTIR